MAASAHCPIPENESQRLDAVRSLRILDTEPELEFDALTRVAAHTFSSPIAVLAMMDADRLWFKSRLGLDVPQLDRKIAFCAHAIMRPREPLVVQDLKTDARFTDNPLVANPPNIRFYAGAPLVDEVGHALGTIAVIDAQPRAFDSAQRAALMDFSTLVMTALQGRQRALEMKRLATTDHLTGIANRAHFDMVLETEMGHALRTGEPVSVLYMDLDGFKEVNDSLGHAAGDDVLREVARRLAGQIRMGDVHARLGGDEFAVVMRQADQNAAAMLARRIAAALERPVTLPGGRMVQVGISVGMATSTAAARSAAALLEEADQSLYRTKKR